MTNYHFWEIYRSQGNIRAQSISNPHYTNLRREYPRYFNLSNDQDAHLFVISSNAVSSTEAATFAQQIAADRVVHHHIDLSQINSRLPRPNLRKGRK